MKQKPKVTPFSPALKALVGTIIAEANQNVVAALQREAEHLQLPKGTTFDIAKGEWRLPA